MRRLADHIQGAQFIAIPDAGHSIWWEAADTFNRAVLTFIGQH
jgi:pimeloyl-ACP methyl ester carboxylesterase